MSYYILDGKTPLKVDLLTWAKWFETADRVVKSDYIGDIHISTVFLGLDHGAPFRNEGRPLIFETIIFGGDNDQYQDRYSTYREAEIGHQKALNIVNGSNILNEFLSSKDGI